jgi:hypothetical protein
MKHLVCLYCEGNDTKIAVLHKENDNAKIKVIRTASTSLVQSSTDLEAKASGLNIEGESLDIDGVEGSASIDSQVEASSIAEMGAALKGINLGKYEFIPALTEPAVYYHLFEGARASKDLKLKQEIIDEILESKNIIVEKESLDFIELADKSLLSVFIVGDIACINLINSLATQHGKRHFKIPTIKSSEISLAYYVAKRKKFFP